MDSLWLVMSRMRVRHTRKPCLNIFLWVKWNAKIMHVPLCPVACVWFKYRLSSYSGVADFTLQCLPAESDTKSKTHSVSRMNEVYRILPFPPRNGRVHLCPFRSCTKGLKVPGPGMKFLCCIAVAKLSHKIRRGECFCNCCSCRRLWGRLWRCAELLWNQEKNYTGSDSYHLYF